jgi:hypothetical protein
MTPVCASMCRLGCSLCAGRAMSLALIPADHPPFSCRERDAEENLLAHIEFDRPELPYFAAGCA